jgi:hypothetical protein
VEVFLRARLPPGERFIDFTPWPVFSARRQNSFSPQLVHGGKLAIALPAFISAYLDGKKTGGEVRESCCRPLYVTPQELRDIGRGWKRRGIFFG